MAGKLKNAPRSRKPKAEKPTRASRIEIVEDAAITSADRAEAINQLLQAHELTAREAATDAKAKIAVEHWRQRLLRPAFGSTRMELVGGMTLAPAEEGVRVEIDGRSGLLVWHELVAASRDAFGEDRDEVEDPDAMPRVQAGSKMIDCPPEGVLCVVLTAACEPNPFQPRGDFNDDELAELADSIQAHGQLTPIDVRPKPGCHWEYQIADGERRWRAIKRFGGKTVEVRIKRRSDEQMAIIGMETAVRRVELNPIEKARQFARFIDEFGWTQDQVAAKYDTSQGQVSNLLRLLRLPESIQQRIMAREIPATHARLLVPYVDAHESFWRRLEKEADLGKGPIESLPNWERSVNAARGWENIDDPPQARDWCTRLPRVPLTAEQIAKLHIVERTTPIGGGRTRVERFATNHAAWKRIVADHEKRYLAEHPEQRPKRPSRAAAKDPAAASTADRGKEPGITPHQRQEFLARWRTHLVGDRFVQLKPEEPDYQALRLFAAGRGTITAVRLFEAAAQLKGVKKLKRGTSAGDFAAALQLLVAAGQLARVERELLVAWFRSADHDRLDPDEAAAAAQLLRIELDAEWRRDLAGPLTVGFLKLHSREELAALLGEYGQLAPPPATAKKELIDRLLGCPEFKRRLPRALAELIAPEAKKGGKHGKTR